MKRGILVAFILSAAFFVPTSVWAIPIHVHTKVPVTHERVVNTDPDGLVVKRWTSMKEVVRVEHVAPADVDSDGIADTEDSCIGTCAPPPTSVAPVPSTGSVVPTSITDCESGGDYSAVNPDSGAYGKYQIIPSTSEAYGCDLSTPAGQDACASEIYSDVGASAWNCG